MIKNVVVGAKKFKLEANANTPRIYRNLFQEDVFTQTDTIALLLEIPKDVESEEFDEKQIIEMTENYVENVKKADTITHDVVEKLFYVMAIQGDESIEEDFEEFLERFGPKDVRDAEEKILSVWLKSIQPTNKKEKNVKKNKAVE